MNPIQELIVDAYGCEANLSDARALEKAARAAVAASGAKVVKSSFHEFQPHGVTLCLILQESHFVLSTWPEYKLAIVNIFLCNQKMDPKTVWKEMARTLKPTHETFHTVSHQVDTGKKAA